MFGLYQHREVKVRKKEIKVKKGNMQSNPMWCVIVPAMASWQAGKGQKQSLGMSLLSMWFFSKRAARKNSTQTSPSNTVRKRNVWVQFPFTFHFSFVKTQLLNNWAACPAPLLLRSQKLRHALRCFTQDQEKSDDPVWVLCQKDREIKKFRVFEEVYKVFVPTQKKIG